MKALLVLCSIILIGCAEEQAPSASKARLIAFGDSNTAASNVSPNFAMQLGAALDRQVLNLAVPGTVIEQQFQDIVKFNYQSTDVVVFMTGYNDMRYYGIDGLAEYTNNLSKLKTFWELRGVKIYVGSTLRMPIEGYAYDATQGLPYHGNDTASSYRDATGSMFKNYINITDEVYPILSNFFDDYRHINQAGHNSVFTAFIARMK